jgi:hypothetical protein
MLSRALRPAWISARWPLLGVCEHSVSLPNPSSAATRGAERATSPSDGDAPHLACSVRNRITRKTLTRHPRVAMARRLSLRTRQGIYYPEGILEHILIRRTQVLSTAACQPPHSVNRLVNRLTG